jgi:hypothetical protein
MNVNEIKEYKSWLVNERHSQRVREQKEDMTFINGEFEQPLIKNKRYLVKSHFATSMMNDITQKMIGDKPRVFVNAKKETDSAQKAVERVAKELNRQAKSLLRQNINPFQSAFKRAAFTHGEAWIYVVHDELLAKWKGYGERSWQNVRPDALPVRFIQYDPMVVFSDPVEEVNGIPARAVVFYKRSVSDVKKNYPSWKPSNDYSDKDMVDFMLYIDNEQFYAEADDVVLFNRPNIYGCVPLAHAYSGYGTETENQDPAALAYSRVRMIREKIVEDAQMSSDFQYNIHTYAHKTQSLYIPAGATVPDDILGNFRKDDDAFNLIYLPEGATPANHKIDESQLFDAAVFAYRQQIKEELYAEHPNSLRGVATGTSGRQEDLLSDAALAFYQAPYENVINLWAQAFEIGLKVCSKVPGMLPPILHEGDVNQYSEVIVDLKREDPLQQAQKKAAGQMLWERGLISMEKFHTEYAGMTLEESRQEQAKLLVEKVKREHPAIQQLILETVAREMGVENEVNQMVQQGMSSDTGLNPIPQYGSQGGQPRNGNIQTQEGMNMADQAAYHEQRLPR